MKSNTGIVAGIFGLILLCGLCIFGWFVVQKLTDLANTLKETQSEKIKKQTEEESFKSQQITYKVRRGDWLSLIGSKFNVDWKEIAKLNNLVAPYILHVGQILIIPGINPEQIQHYIQILKPNIETIKKVKLANYYAFLCNKYKLNPKVFVSIAYQENSFHYSGISGNDIGHMQLNYYWQFVKNGRAEKYTIEEINTNWKLNAELAAQYLIECGKRHPRKNPLPSWVCYNSKTLENQEIYFQSVARHIGRLT